MDIKEAHKFSSNHRNSILESKNCGCFSCLLIFSPNEIENWFDEDENGVGQTAECPKCHMDTLLGDNDVEFDTEFLKSMNKYFFGGNVDTS